MISNRTAEQLFDTSGQLMASQQKVFDELGRLLQSIGANGQDTTYGYDRNNNLTSTIDPLWRVHESAYDGLNRLIKDTTADGSEVIYTYDSATHGIGRLARLTDSSGEMAWVYDAHGRTIQRRQTITHNGTSHTLITAWQYNGAGQLSGMTYPSGLQLNYHYTNGKISALTLNGEPLLSAISYRPFGPISGWQWANGSSHQRGYDLDGRLTTQSLGNSERQLNYDAVGNITTLSDAANEQVFNYDELNRLIAANDTTLNLAWVYDANGNRLGETDHDITTPYDIDASSNRLLAKGALAYQYDSNGHLINDGEHSYQYDARQRLITIDEGATGEYRYNALGQRIYKKGIANPCDANGDGSVTHADLKQVTGKDKQAIDADGPGKGEPKGKGQSIACIATQMNNGNGKTKEGTSGSRQLLFVYDEHRLLGEYDMAGNPIQDTVWLGDIPVATVQGGNTYAIHTDHLGTPRVITDSTGKEVWQWLSDPFGVATANDDPDRDGVKFSYNLRFPGQYYDAETGKHYNYFRDYDPATGRYIESDPIGLAGGLNTYGYVYQNPIRYSDVFGLDVNICFYRGVIPHIGLGVNTLNTTGRRTDGTEFPFPGRDVPGEVSPDSGEQECTSISTTSMQDNSLQDYIDRNVANPGHYNLTQRSCVDFVRDGLHNELGMILGDTNSPWILYQEIMRRSNAAP